MVSAVVLLVTVSTLVVHGKQVSRDGSVIPSGCEGKTLCDIKPADYPQKEIDNYFKKNPEYLKRIKKDVTFDDLNPPLEDGNIDGNCKTEIVEILPYIKIKKSKLPVYIVQSGYFKQTLREVKCKESKSSLQFQCFKAFVGNIYAKTSCKQITRQHKLVVFDPITGTIKQEHGIINVDCVCAAEK